MWEISNQAKQNHFFATAVQKGDAIQTQEIAIHEFV